MVSEGVFKAHWHNDEGVMIADFPAATKDELIRCRDCIYWRDEDFCANPQWQTGRPSNGLIAFPCTFPESFCSYAEKREGDE